MESHFRAIGEPWARCSTGGSTGGWEALALQIFHPDFFGGTFAACPDPVDFRALQIVNIYEWDNAWRVRRGWSEVALPGERNTDGLVLSTMEMQLKYERARGPRGRSGEQWDAWQAAYGPAGADGYRAAVDPQTRSDHRQHAGRRGVPRPWLHSEKHPPEARARGLSAIRSPHCRVTYYLNNAVRLLDDFLDKARPAYGGSILYGPRQPHCWVGPLSLPQRILQIAEYAASHAPRDADRAWWRW